MSGDPQFDPDGPGLADDGVFGLTHSRDEASVVLLPVPFDATTSYGTGTASGPAAIRNASVQVDLLDHRLGRIYERGIYMTTIEESITRLSEQTRAISAPIIARGGATSADLDSVRRIDEAGERVRVFVFDQTSSILEEGKTPGIIGGEHSVSLGAIQACAEHHGSIGILQIDAHMDLRESYEGFRFSHASVMHNVLAHAPSVERIVQVGVRDFGERELERVESSGGRIRAWYDDDLFRRTAGGERFAELCRLIIDELPERVYISFDIDGLDPALCPNTGTPVPGGLTFREAALLLHTLAESERRIVGFDLVEVCPGSDGSEWDANVGARIVYKLCGLTRADRKV